MITKETLVDRIEVNSNNTINILLKHVLKEDEEILQQDNFRFVLVPGENIDETFSRINTTITGNKKAAVASTEIDRVQWIASAVWTPEVIQAYQESLSQEIL